MAVKKKIHSPVRNLMVVSQTWEYSLMKITVLLQLDSFLTEVSVSGYRNILHRFLFISPI
jgi:hypothetical protein